MYVPKYYLEFPLHFYLANNVCNRYMYLSGQQDSKLQLFTRYLGIGPLGGEIDD